MLACNGYRLSLLILLSRVCVVGVFARTLGIISCCRVYVISYNQQLKEIDNYLLHSPVQPRFSSPTSPANGRN